MDLIDVAGLARPKPTERTCGDAWLSYSRPDGVFLAIVDALGHGPEAAHAAQVAITYLQDNLRSDSELLRLDHLLLGMDQTLTSTRGAVAGLAFIEPAARRIHYAGVGNTDIHLCRAGRSHLFSRAGFLGGNQTLRVDVQTTTLGPGAVLILHTDGIEPMRETWMTGSDPCTELARKIIEHSARPYDDAAVVVAHWLEDRNE